MEAGERAGKRLELRSGRPAAFSFTIWAGGVRAWVRLVLEGRGSDPGTSWGCVE